MKVLFVCSGNSEFFEIAPFIQSQADSLVQQGLNVEFFTIKGKGFSGYFKSIFSLRKILKNNNVDLIHAHYALSGWVAFLGSRGIPIVCSYMGSDSYGDTNEKGNKKISSYREIILAILLQLFLDRIIVKSENLYKYIWRKKRTSVIPNGVDLSKYKIQDRTEARKLLKLHPTKKYILFLGDTKNLRKNFNLLKLASKLSLDLEFEILAPFPVIPEGIPTYLFASDVFVLTSFLEGSPNVIKEAMACCVPIVSTDVGDVKWIFGNEPGHFISSFYPADLAEKIKLSIMFSEKNKVTKGLERLIELELDSKSIAKRIIDVYSSSLK